MNSCISKVGNSNRPCFIQGDFNYNLIDVDHPNTCVFTDVMFDNSFYPHINLPTRITPTSATCIDHIWSNVYDCDVHAGIISETIADHLITFQCADITIPSTSSSENKKSYKKIDFEELPLRLSAIKTDDILKSINQSIKFTFIVFF